MSKRRVRGYPPALLKPMPSHFSSSDDEEENSGRRRLTRHEKRELEKRDYEKARKMQEEENRKKWVHFKIQGNTDTMFLVRWIVIRYIGPISWLNIYWLILFTRINAIDYDGIMQMRSIFRPVGFRQRQPSPVVEFARTLDLGSTVPQAEAGDNRGSNAYDDMDDGACTYGHWLWHLTFLTRTCVHGFFTVSHGKYSTNPCETLVEIVLQLTQMRMKVTNQKATKQAMTRTAETAITEWGRQTISTPLLMRTTASQVTTSVGCCCVTWTTSAKNNSLGDVYVITLCENLSLKRQIIMHSAATRRRGRKRKKLYYRGVKIKVPRGFFSKWTTVQRGNWTTQTKKDYQLPPYNVHEDDDAKERHDARRERERVNKSNSRGFAKLKKMLRVALEDGATSTSTKRPEVELEYSKDEVAKELNRYGICYSRNCEHLLSDCHHMNLQCVRECTVYVCTSWYC